MNWNILPQNEPPVDKELLMYYENGIFDKGYIIAVKNSNCGWKLPVEGKNYYLMKWILIEDLEKCLISTQSEQLELPLSPKELPAT